jgi:hypothetical protein
VKPLEYSIVANFSPDQTLLCNVQFNNLMRTQRTKGFEALQFGIS